MSTNSRSNVIVATTRLLQELELDYDKQRVNRINEIQTQRRRTQKVTKATKDQDFNDKMNRIKDLDQHRLTLPNFYDRVGLDEISAEAGLTSQEAERRHEEQGPNTLTQKVGSPWYMKLFHEFFSFFSIILWIGAILCFIAFALDTTDKSNVYLGVVLIIIVVVSGLVTFFQNSKSESIMEGFKNFIPQMCTVIRDGKPAVVPAIKIVRGDVIEVKEGERIPADIRIVVSNEMKVDNSSLTGETDPLLRSEKCDQPDKILETKNVAFFGTLCKYGKGRGIVFNIGDDTIIGQIAGLADLAKPGKTPLRREIDRFIVYVTCLALCLGLIFLILGFIVQYRTVQNIVFAIGIVVASVPEGLLAAITITLSIAAKRLSRKKVLVKNLESVETLGSTSCICSDKTGTLTQNKMTVENLWYNLKTLKGENREKRGANFAYEYNVEDEHFKALQRCAVLSSTAVFSDSMPENEMNRLDEIKKQAPEKYQHEYDKARSVWAEKLKTMPYYDRTVIGDASETALTKFFQPLYDVVEFRKLYATAQQFDDSPAIVPFNSSYKYALQIKALPNDPTYSFEVYIKGAPEHMWARCTYVFANGEATPRDEHIDAEFVAANKAFARNGERVLGFARQRLRRDEYPADFRFNIKDPFKLPFTNTFEFLGLVSLIDPPRDSVPDAINKCKTAGIKVIMVTGDQQLTAASIAKKIGIFEGKTSVDLADETGMPYELAVEQSEAIVINGEMLTKAAVEDEGLPESEKGKTLEKWLKKPQIVFARTSPAQKLYIVKGCQKLGYIVAVTGDGVNDSPAIKQADIGIAMGITGSDVAKDAADMILLNDDFSSIILGIEEGRKIFDNLKKGIMYVLSANMPCIIAFVTSIIVGLPSPLSPVLILCISIGTDIFPLISFAYEDAEIDIMTRLPRSPNDHLVTQRLLTNVYFQTGIIQTCAGLMSYFIIMNCFGFSPGALVRLASQPYFSHNPGDTYDPRQPFFGNTNVQCVEGVLTYFEDYGRDHREKDNLHGVNIDWLYTLDQDQDLRMGFLKLNGPCAPENIVPTIAFEECKVMQISPVSKRPVCYSTEALKYAQTAFFFSIVFSQFSNTLCCKTRKLSLSSQGLGNMFMVLGWAVEFSLMIILAYCRPLNNVLGTRDLIFYHFGMYSLFFSMFMLAINETRKYLIRNFPAKEGKPNWFERCTLI